MSTRPWPALCPTWVPLLPVTRLLLRVYGVALGPSQRETLSKVSWPQDLQLHSPALVLSQPCTPAQQVWRAQRRGQVPTLNTARAAEPEGDGRGPGSLPGVAAEWSGHTEARVCNRPGYTPRLTRSPQRPAGTGALAHPAGQGMEAWRGGKAA